METIRLTTAHAIVRYLVAQRTMIDQQELPLFPGVFAIFGHGNVTCLGQALEESKEQLPTWRGQNEQGMALAATAYAKATRRRQIMVATSSVGPGATNMVTAAGVAHANRLPLLLLAGDTFASRLPDPVLQQVEHFGEPSTTVNDAFRAVTRFWDRITTPEQLISTLPHAVQTMLDPATCGPALIALPQDVQAQAYDFPVRFFEPVLHRITRPRADRSQLDVAARAIAQAQKPLIVAGGGVHYSLAEEELLRFVEAHNIPVVETMAGKASLLAAHPLNAGPIGVTGCASANALAAEADLVLAVGTRLGDFTTGSWSVFANEQARIVGINVARFDATKHLAIPVVGDARETLGELTSLLGEYRAGDQWSGFASDQTSQYHAYIDKISAADPADAADVPTYAQVVGVIDRVAGPEDVVVSAAGGFPGEVSNGWRAKALNSFDCEYGFSCMGYEISGGWGAAMALPHKDITVLTGDGSYLMMNSDLYSSVLSGHKMIVIVCDNGGFAVINRLQVNQGGRPFNNLLADANIVEETRVDFAGHARAMGCEAETVSTIAELEAAYVRAKASDRTYVIALQTQAHAWTEGGAWWEVGVPEVSNSESVQRARSELEHGKQKQRAGW